MNTAPGTVARAYSLARHLAAGYAAVVVYASLSPFSGWTDSGAPLFAFLGAQWPRYTTAFDLAANVLAYVPLGLLAMAALRHRLEPVPAAGTAWLAAAALSLTLETVQNFLPSRVPSNVDLGCNALGALIGCALALRHARIFADDGVLARWRARHLAAGRIGDAGVLLGAAWLLAQLDPQSPALGSGDLRGLLGLAAPVGYGGELSFALAVLITWTGVIAAGLVGWLALREPSAVLLAAVFAAALAIKSLAWSVLAEPSAWLQWLTPGTLPGLPAGAATLALALWLPRRVQVSLAALALLAMTALVNLAPENPYAAAALSHARTGHFLNFNGLTQLVTSLWPFLALAYLLALPAAKD